MDVQSFRNHWRMLSPEGKQELAVKLQTSTAYLSQIAHGHRSPSKSLAELAKITTGINFGF